MVNVTISGLPKNVKIPKFMAYLENTVFKDTLDARLIKTLIIGGTFKTITLKMRSNDARKARRYLDGLEYEYGGNVFPLQCWSEDTQEKLQHSVSPHKEQFANYLEQSESPMAIRKELETIDLKIELLKKQRMLMEEESKLLLEKKKLEMLRNIGPNDYENLAKFEKVCGRNKPNEKANILHPSTSNAKKKTGTKLPSFNAPCKMILAEMNQVLAEYVNPDNRDMIMSLIYAAIRKRLLIVLQGKNILPAQDIVRLYRERYPQNSDRKLLEDLTKTISQSCWPIKSDNENDQIITKTEEPDILDNIKKASIEDVNEENEVQEVKDSVSFKELEIEELVSSKELENEELVFSKELKNEELVSSKELENEVLVSSKEHEIEELVSSKEHEIEELFSSEKIKDEELHFSENPEKSETVDFSVNENTLEDLDNIDQVVDMDNDFDEWVENDMTNENDVEVEEQMI